MDNLKLWESVCKTDPKTTKPVSFGKRKFTAIDAITQIKRATELWGPFGDKWGLKGLVFTELLQGQGLMAQATLIYPVDKDTVGAIPIAADMKYDPNGDCVKKLQTELISKALSRLGFNADVFEGKFDDNKYVAMMEKEHAKNDSSNQTSSGMSGTNAGSDTKKSKVSTQNSKSTGIQEPDPTAAGILGTASQMYMDQMGEDYEGYYVDYKKLCKLVYEKYQAYPSKPESAERIVNDIPLEDVITKSDFLDGL